MTALHSLPPIQARAAAAQATLDRFKDRELRYGVNDCVRMTAMHIRRLGWSVPLPNCGSYRSAASGLKRLRELGHDNLAGALDALGFPRIAPAAAVVGDVLLLPGDDRIGALAIALGNGRAIGYHEDAAGAIVLQPLAIESAWRIDPAWAVRGG